MENETKKDRLMKVVKRFTDQMPPMARAFLPMLSTLAPSLPDINDEVIDDLCDQIAYQLDYILTGADEYCEYENG